MNWDMPITLQEAVYDGLTGLMALRLRGTPAAENVQKTAKIWLAAMGSRPISWDAELDLERIQRAFVELAATMDRWPAPADFMAVLPPRKPQLSLAAPTDRNMSPETRKLIDGLLTRMRANSRQQEPS